MGEKGVVTEIKGELVVVRMTRTEACAKCRACTAGMSTQDMMITAKNLCGAKLYDVVNIELADGDFLSAVLISYGLPFCGLIAGFALGYGAGGFLAGIPREITGFLLGIVLMLLAFAWIHSKEEYWKSRNYVPSATEVCGSEPEQ